MSLFQDCFESNDRPELFELYLQILHSYQSENFKDGGTLVSRVFILFELRRKKTCLWRFRPDSTKLSSTATDNS